jgi:hypothetical protein
MKVFLSRFSPLLFLAILLVALTSCSPKKESISEYDMKRVLERFASARIQTGIASDVNQPAPSDQALFEEACDVYRLPTEKAKAYLKEKNSSLYESIYGN